MATLTIRLPDDKHERLKALAERRNISPSYLSDPHVLRGSNSAYAVESIKVCSGWQ